MAKDVEIEVDIMGDTGIGGALRVSNGKTRAWIPKSLINDKCEEKGVITSIFIPEWLAEEKGLI